MIVSQSVILYNISIKKLLIKYKNNMTKFKEGDKVKIINKDENNLTGYRFNYCNYRDPKSYIGLEGVIVIDDESPVPYKVLKGDDYLGWYREEDLELATKSFDNPQIGDEYKDSYGNSRFVLGVVGLVIFISSINDKVVSSTYKTKEELIREGYTIIQDKVEEEIPEYTMEEVCKMVGKEIKIKK